MNRTKNASRQLRKNPTDAERLLWRKLRFWQVDGLKFRRQQPLGRYIVDFVCLEKRLVIEVDGGQHSEQVLTMLSEISGCGIKVSMSCDFGITMYLRTSMESLTWLSKPCEIPPSLILPRKRLCRN